MDLFIEATTHDNHGIDLDDLWSDATDTTEFFEMIVVEVANYAIDKGIPFGDVMGLTFDDDDGEELAIAANSDDTLWIHEVVKLYDHLKTTREHYIPDEAILAYIDNVGWAYFDFDADFKYAEGQYSQEFVDEDYEEYARDHMSDYGNEIPEELESYFDYAGYGESLVEEYSRVTWGSTVYLFSN